MASEQLIMEADQAFLPHDMVITILERLPVKSLIRFRIVGKNWEKLIKTPSFIRDQLHQSSHQNHLLLLKWHRAGSAQMQVGFLDRDMQVLEVQKSPLANWNFAWIVGSSNGLLCVVEKGVSDALLLWNPAIRKVRKVCLETSATDYFFGFGFSPNDNDYKIVRIKVLDYQIVPKRMKVYSLNSESWKKVEVANLEGFRVRSSRNVTVNGVVFWIGGKQGGNDYDQILSYDLSKEEFTVIPMPILNSYDEKRLIVYENKVAVVACIKGEDKLYSIHLWVREEDTFESRQDCKKWSWTKRYTSCPCPCKLKPVSMWKNEIVFLPFDTGNDGQTPILYLLNITTDVFKKLAVGSNSYNIELFNYVEGLALLAHDNVEKL
ncbi:putative F-box/LRR-repeat/kelch-repeat protein At1g11620 [Neltuma alba]|uniref:putative F-box/LRR-repeat/kelch-repeat protein At1g11620 n=1 Tax=Neltuma alba TaxID=207710 RepID=UPI0010A422D4|nr:putative F-box/LRR-repeat/kelch-repeat protein At1g11620 [Prosopis alba]